MSSTSRIFSVCVMLVGLSVPAVLADRAMAQSRSTSRLSEALDSWRTGDLIAARDLLSGIVDAGTRDARVLYYRGILREQTGEDGSEDFEAAARLEVGARTSRRINQALERIQGPLRTKIESIRETARAAGSSDPVAATHALRYRDAVSAIRSGDLTAAAAGLDQLIAEGTRSPRAWYLRGVVAQRTGDSAGAGAFFEQGLSRENTLRDMELVNEALGDLPGDVRRQIEEQVTVVEDDQQVTRRDRFRTLLAREHALREDAIAAGGAEQERRAQEEAAVRRALEEQAAAQFRDEQQRAEDAARRSEAIAESPLAGRKSVPVAENSTVPPVPQLAAEQPATSASPDSADSASLPAEAADDEPRSGGPVNPFSRKGASSPSSASTESSGVVDFSWLAPNLELIVFSRPAAMLESPFMASVRELPWFEDAMAQMSGQTGISPLDIESITFGMGDLMAQLMAGALQPAGADGRPDPGRIAAQFANSQSAISVVRTKKDLDLAAAIRTVGGQEQSYGDRTWFLIPAQAPNAPATAVCAIDGRTVLAGSETSLKAALDRGAGSPANPQFGFLNSERHFALAFSSPALAPMSGSVPIPPEAPALVQELMNAIRGQVNGIAIVLHAETDLQLSVQLSLSDASAGEAAVKVVEQAITMAQQMYPAMQDNVPPPLQEVASSAVGSLQTGFSNSVLSATVSFPSELIAAVQNLGPLLGPMMGGGIQPPDANPGFGPGDFGSDPNFSAPSDSGFGLEPAEPGNDPAATDSPAEPSATDGAFGFEPDEGTNDPSPADFPPADFPPADFPPADFPPAQDPNAPPAD